MSGRRPSGARVRPPTTPRERGVESATRRPKSLVRAHVAVDAALSHEWFEVRPSLAQLMKHRSFLIQYDPECFVKSWTA